MDVVGAPVRSKGEEELETWEAWEAWEAWEGQVSRNLLCRAWRRRTVS